MWRLVICSLLLMPGVIPATAESSLNYTGITLFEEQSNYPELSESVDPTPGNPWTWTASSFSGFSGSPTIWFDYQNEDHTIAKLHWNGIATMDWQNGVDGSFTLTLSNGVDEDIVYSVDLSLRCFIGDGYTIFEQQTGGGDGFSAAGANGFVTMKTGSSSLPGDLSITFNPMGAVTSCASAVGSWTEDGSIEIMIADGGSRPASIVNNWPVSLRSLVGDGYTIFEQQTGGGDGFSAAGANGFVTMKTGSSSLPADLSITFNPMGAVTSCASAVGSWTEDGSIEIMIADGGSRPASIVNNWPVSLRSLVGDGYTIFEQQTGGGDGFSAAGANGFVTMKTGSSSLPGDLSITFNPMGAVTSCASAVGSWTEDGSIEIMIADGGSRPASIVNNWPVSLRSLVGDGYTIFEQQTGGGDGFSAAGANGFVTMKTGSSSLPADLSITFNPMGAVTSCASAVGSWTEDGSIEIMIADGGSRPASIVNNWPVSLRSLVGDGYTIFEQQTGGGDGFSAAGANGFVTMKTGSSSLPGDLSITFNPMGAVTSCASAVGSWTEDGSIEIMIADGGSRPASIVNNWPVSLRSLVGDGYTIFEQQTGGGDGFSAAGANGFVTMKTGSSSLPGDLSITFNPMGAVTSCASAVGSWTEDGSIEIMIADGGSRPASIVNNWPVSLRSITPNPLTIPDDGNAGSVVLEVESDSGPWDWIDYVDGLSGSVLTAPDTYSSSTLTISWGTGALVSGESGNGSIDVQVSDGSSPESRVTVSATIIQAGCCNGDGIRGNVDDIVGPAGAVDVSDLTYLVAYLFSAGDPPPCEDEGNVDGIIGPAGPMDVSDLTYLVAYLFGGGPPPAACP